MEGWIKLHRKFLDWEWFEDSNMVKLWIFFLFRANLEDKKWKGKTVRKGQFITGRKKLSKELRMSEQNIRTCLTRLKSTNEITIESTNRFSLITIVNWTKYQIKSTNKATSQTPTSNQQATTSIEDKKKEVINIVPKSEFLEYGLKEIGSLGKDPKDYLYSLGAKYDSWAEDGWKDGNGRKIKNWKTKLRNTIPHLKPVYGGTEDGKIEMKGYIN